MLKNLNSGGLIAYGPTLPVQNTVPDGTLFYKTDGSSGGAAGLYIYGFIKDSNPNSVGNQITQDWSPVGTAATASLAGGTLTSSLTVPDILRVTNQTGGQRILVGNQSNGALPAVLEGANGVLTIATGANWSTGGTLTSGLVINPGAGNAGLTWLGSQVWHSGNDGANSTLDADLLDGQHGSYYLNVTNMNAGTLAVSRGGTGMTTLTQGGIVYGASSSAMGSTAAGTAGQLLVSGGTAAPVWTAPASITVGNATYATSAGAATSATNATNATNASNVPWTGITGMNAATPAATSALVAYTNFPATGFSTYARPSYFYTMGSAGSLSMRPNQFPSGSISGFDAYLTSDIGQYQCGMTVVGTQGAGGYSMQLAACWDTNLGEGAPSSLRFRTNDDTGDTTAWSAWATIYNDQNLKNVSQLTNDAGYITSAPLSGYVAKSGDSMSGNLTINGITLTHSTSSVTATSIGGATITTEASGVGCVTLQRGSSTKTGFLTFYGANSVRIGYIGFSDPVATQDTGQLRFIAGSSYFNGTINTDGDVISSASDARLKTNIKKIENAVEKVGQLSGYEYDWNERACQVAGFTPVRTHEHGVLAQEVEAVMPDAVVKSSFNDEYKTVRYERLVSLLISAMNEQQEQINALKAELAELKK